MRILLLTAGSRGDVDPFVALAQRAAARGHEVRLGVTREFTDQVRAAGLDPAPLDGNYADLIARQGVSPWSAYRSFRTQIRPMMAAMLRSAAEAAMAYRPDVVVHHPKVLSAPLAAARLDVPHVLVEIVPTVTPTREFPAAGVTTVDLGRLQPVHLPGLRCGQRDAPRAVARDPVVAGPARPGRRPRPGEHARPRQPGPASTPGRLARDHRADGTVAARSG